MGSPPEAGSKKDVLKFLSVNNIVNAAANTGRDRANSQAVINTDQPNKGITSKFHLDPRPDGLILIVVTIKFTAPNKDDKPAKCKLKIAKSTDAPL
jgi:hypothetical protein